MQKLLDLMQELREKCPWDRKQTPQSLTSYAIEEAYEVEAAIQDGDLVQIRAELGDLLLQVVFQAQMYDEQGAFNFNDVVDTLCEKLIRRHPHIFNAVEFSALTADEVSLLWQQVKQQEKQNQAQSRLDDIKHGPALQQAAQIQKKAAKLGFDFANVQDAYDKLHEELGELEQAIALEQSDEIQAELGDCLFSLLNVGRKLGINNESALLATISKFRQRFAYIEKQASLQQKTLEEMSLAEMEALWQQAKQQLQI